MRLAIVAAMLLAGISAPSLAQDQTGSIEGRVGKIERELRAVQRRVFPGGAGATVEPEISAAPTPITPEGTPATTPIADLTARVNVLERELANLTGQIEQNGFKVRQVEDAFAKFKADAEFRLTAIEGGGRTTATEGASGPFTAAPPSDLAPPAEGTPPTDVAPPALDAAPATGDAGEDAYMAGYRLWEAKRYPEAQAALKDSVAKYPRHARNSFARNLLGRAYLDGGKPNLAAQAFLENYQTNPKGERAPDSLFYLGQTLTQLNKRAEACKVYDELRDVYGATLRDTLRPRVAQGRVDAKCAA